MSTPESDVLVRRFRHRGSHFSAPSREKPNHEDTKKPTDHTDRHRSAQRRQRRAGERPPISIANTKTQSHEKESRKKPTDHTDRRRSTQIGKNAETQRRRGGLGGPPAPTEQPAVSRPPVTGSPDGCSGSKLPSQPSGPPANAPLERRLRLLHWTPGGCPFDKKQERKRTISISSIFEAGQPRHRRGRGRGRETRGTLAFRAVPSALPASGFRTAKRPAGPRRDRPLRLCAFALFRFPICVDLRYLRASSVILFRVFVVHSRDALPILQRPFPIALKRGQ